MTHVLVTAQFPEQLLDKIRAVSPQIELEVVTLNGRFWPEDRQTDADIVYSVLFKPPQPQQAPNLKWVQMHFAGVDGLQEQSLWSSDILITTTSGIHAPNMGQYVMTQLLAWAHRVPTWMEYQGQGKWPQQRWNKFLPQELRGQTLGILGYGSIGREITRLAKGFGMKVLVTKKDVMHPEDNGFIIPGIGDPTGDLPDRIYPMQATRSMLALCDFVVITLPLTEETHHLFDESLLHELKPTSFVVNVGRGSIIDEKALVKALKRGWIAGAGLDVYEEEPLPEDSPLWKLDNVILTPHVSGFTSMYDDRAIDLFAENLRRYLAGEPLLNRVDRVKGY